MNSGITADRVYAALKDQLMSGTLRPGRRLEPATLASDLMSSATPVRDALHRLLGESMVEARPGSGFHVIALNEPDLRDLYAWNAHLLTGAVRLWRPSQAHDVPDVAHDKVEATRTLFHQIGRLSGNREIVRAIDAASDRLGAVRSVERRLAPEIGDDLDGLAATFSGADGGVALAIRRYHKRRQAIVPALIQTLYRTA